MVVDDSQSIKKMLEDTLEKAGYIVLSADSGQAALDIINNNNIDLLITDYLMPEMSGVELTKVVRQLPQYKSIPILLLSTESSADEKRLARDAGATGWIVKPFDPEQLISVVERVTSSQQIP